MIVEGGAENVGIYFNPLKKLSFRLEWGSDVVMTGYAKMNEVKQVDGKGTYEITLFGELGKVFGELQKITFDESTTTPEYLIDGSEYVDEHINKDLIWASWIHSGQNVYDVKKKNESHYDVSDIIGFAPNNSFSQDFKHDTFQTDANNSKTFKDVLEESLIEGKTFAEDTGVSADTAIPNGMLPREIGEYRSYLQLPYIYWNKLFQIFQEKAETLTGYTFDFDTDWFNQSNPYWYNLVYMLKSFDTKNGSMTDNANIYTVNPYSSMGWQKTSSINTMTTHRTTNLCTYQNAYTETVPMIDPTVSFNDGKWYTLSDDRVTVFKINSLWRIWDGDGSSSTSTLNTNNALIVKANAVGENGNTITTKFLIKHPDCTLTESGATVINFDGSTKAGNADIINIDAQFIVDKEELGNSVRFRFEAYWQNSNWSLTSNGDIVNFDPYTTNNPNRVYVTLFDGIHRSFAHFTLNDLWNKDYNLFGEILKYCKMFRIGISVDEFEKKIYFKPFIKYFSTYIIEDWTDKVDKSKDFTIKPITFENKYVLFNYEDNKTKSGAEYKEKYGVNYG